METTLWGLGISKFVSRTFNRLLQIELPPSTKMGEQWDKLAGNPWDCGRKIVGKKSVSIGVILGLYWGYIGIMEEKMGTTIEGL